MKTVFGPVPSRRLGRSLGIDVIPPKTCSYDCVYCESGATTHLSVKRRAFFSPDRVMADLEEYFREYPQGADVLTFSSAGEPTLYEPLGELIGAIKGRFPSIPLIVLTNGSLLWDATVRAGLMKVDRVVPSLDAVSEDIFRQLNRPHPGLDLSMIIEGLYAFGREYRGQLHMEVMLVSGINDHPEELTKIRRVLDRIEPQCIELNTVARPPADPAIRGIDEEGMKAIRCFFPEGRSQIIGKFQAASRSANSADLSRRVLEMVRRRPCMLPEMSVSLGVALEDLNEVVARLRREGWLECSALNDTEYFYQRSEKE